MLGCMISNVIRTFITGYGLAAAAAVALILAGGPLWLAAITAWVGGPALVLAFALVPRLGRLVMPPVDSETIERERANWQMGADELRAWEEDLARERAEYLAMERAWAEQQLERRTGSDDT